MEQSAVRELKADVQRPHLLAIFNQLAAAGFSFVFAALASFAVCRRLRRSQSQEYQASHAPAWMTPSTVPRASSADNAGPCAVFLVYPMMCQLLGMSCNTPTDFCFSFTGFAERAGRTDIHKDGFGIAFYEGRGLRMFLDVLPACESPIAALVKANPIKALTVVAHIRYSTVGGVALENVHPFTRELWGAYWVFAHNGDLPPDTLSRLRAGVWSPYHPVGDTDSEAAFCHILNALVRRFPGGVRPPKAAIYGALCELVADLVQEPGTILNFLLCDGEDLFVGCWPGTRPGSTVYNSLSYLVREHPFQTAQLSDCDYSIDFSTVTSTQDRVAVIATKPLTTNETWIPMQKGDLFLFREGRALRNQQEVDLHC